MTRTHKEIIGPSPTAFANQIGAVAGSVKQWRRLNSIPAPYWAAVVREGLATLEELAAAAEARRLSPESAAA